MKPIIAAAALLSVLAATSETLAQTKHIEGQVRAGAAAIANQPVSLHRVTNQGGSTIATDTTDRAGRFSFDYDPEGGEAIHFVATRYEGQLYIGETFRDAPTAGEYIVAVGPNATPINLGPAVGTTPPPRPADPASRRAGAAVIAAVVSLSVLIVYLVSRRKTSPTRRLLVEIADLDNRHEARAISDYHEQRNELLRRLRESA